MLPHAQQTYNKTPPWVRKDSYLAQGLDQLPMQDTEPSPSSIPMTLQRAAPNSGKKRKAPDLSRCTPGSSHYNKISAIFGDAGRTLCVTPSPRLLQTNARRLRMPFSTTSSPKKLLSKANLVQDSERDDVSPGKENLLPLGGGVLSPPMPPPLETLVRSRSQSRGHTYQPSNNVTARGCYCVNELPSSGFNTPTGNGTINERTSPEEVIYPDLTPSQPILGHTKLLGATEQRGSGGTMLGIESWLTQVPDKSTPEFIDRPGEAHFSRGRSESPSRVCVPSRRDLSYTPPILSDESTDQAPARFPHPLTPRRYLSSPPKRKAPRLSPTKDGSLAGPTNEQFDIYEDECSHELVELSPTVEKYRKGRRPKRERCVSYWDDDVLPSLAGQTDASEETDGDRQPLCELHELTRAKGFVDGVENADFDFNIQLNARDT
ncbi:MAG: hypothetical protein L6R42_000447 [Xanthoria sp. 1 TBL-2021]|nr:MAG: hypothetical protein L6R42_000447 [Xanthoria sp. 1 TBL-2021]